MKDINSKTLKQEEMIRRKVLLLKKYSLRVTFDIWMRIMQVNLLKRHQLNQSLKRKTFSCSLHSEFMKILSRKFYCVKQNHDFNLVSFTNRAHLMANTTSEKELQF